MRTLGRSILVSQADERFARRPEACRTCVRIDGINLEQKNAMRQLFMEGKYSIAEVARAVGVDYTTAKKAINDDDDLRNAWETTFQQKMDHVEQAMVERAIDGRNEIAAQQAGEFLLRHRRKGTYGDNAIPTDMLKALPKIVIPMVVSRSPLQQDAIEVKGE